MPTIDEAATTFLARRRIAVTGVSRVMRRLFTLNGNVPRHVRPADDAQATH
jgi:hypothetical protein